MDKSNPLYKVNYEDWKKNLWGALRAFVAGFLASLSVHLLTINGDNIGDLDWWLNIVLVGSLVGGLIGIGKFLRDLFPESPILAKLPI